MNNGINVDLEGAGNFRVFDPRYEIIGIARKLAGEIAIEISGLDI